MSRSRYSTPTQIPSGPKIASAKVAPANIYAFYPMSTDEQLRTVFIGNLPNGIPDERINNFLQLISGFQKWLRITNASNKNLNFGFARFVNPMATKVALEVLSNVNYKENDSENHLKISVESNTLHWLSAKAGHVSVESHQGLSMNDLVSRINLLISKWQQSSNEQIEDEIEESVDDGDLIDFINKSIRGSQTQEFSSNVNESEAAVLRREIKSFREQSLKIEKSRMLANEEYEKKKLNELEEKSSKIIKSDNKDVNIRMNTETNVLMKEFEKYEVSDEDNNDDNSTSTTQDDLLNEQAAIEQTRASKEKLFITEQSRWLSREKAHFAAVKREKEREENYELKLKSLHESALKEYELLAEQEEDISIYIDIKNRSILRRRELQRDEDDIFDENHEKESLPDTSIPTTTTNKKISLSLSKPTKSTSINENKLFNEPQQQQITNKNARIELENEIESFDNLFNWEIKWDYLDENILEDTLRPLIEHNIIEYLGVQEEDLINFVLNHIKSHKPANELITELEMTLDEDAIIFTKKIWRSLITETEIKYRKISS